MFYKNQVFVFVVSFLIVGFFLLSKPEIGFSGGAGVSCCQETNTTCYTCIEGQLCQACPVKFVEGIGCDQQSGQCGPPPGVTFSCTHPSCQFQQNCENLGICSLGGGASGIPCGWTGTQCVDSILPPTTPTPPPAVTFSCTDPDCQSQQNCENLGVCSLGGGDSGIPCGWTGTQCVDSILPPATPMPTPPDGAFQPGDANGDGVINILDVTALLNHILVISSAPGNGDCNEDGQVNILDVTCVLNIILGL